MAAVTAQLIYESPLSAGPITTFLEDSSDIHVTMRHYTTNPGAAGAPHDHDRVVDSVILPPTPSFFSPSPERSDSLVR